MHMLGMRQDQIASLAAAAARLTERDDDRGPRQHALGSLDAAKCIRNTQQKKKAKTATARELNRLSLLLTLTAVLFFTGAVWALGRKGN